MSVLQRRQSAAERVGAIYSSHQELRRVPGVRRKTVTHQCRYTFCSDDSNGVLSVKKIYPKDTILRNRVYNKNVRNAQELEAQIVVTALLLLCSVLLWLTPLLHGIVCVLCKTGQVPRTTGAGRGGICDAPLPCVTPTDDTLRYKEVRVVCATMSVVYRCVSAVVTYMSVS